MRQGVGEAEGDEVPCVALSPVWKATMLVNIDFIEGVEESESSGGILAAVNGVFNTSRARGASATPAA